MHLQEISDDLMSHFSTLIASELPSEATAVQQKAYVTFTLPSVSALEDSDQREERTVTLLERRHLISGSQTTGFRTWEASLHLGAYLCTQVGQRQVRGKSVLELGAGTGFISILCAKHLGAKHVTATDGDEGVVEALKENLFLNDLDDEQSVLTSILRWGRGLKGTWVQEECEAWPYDTVLGADIVKCPSQQEINRTLVLTTDTQTYDKTGISALVATLRFLFDLRPKVQVVISGAVRNAETFETFRHACCKLNSLIEILNAY